MSTRNHNTPGQSVSPHHIPKAREISSWNHDETITWLRSFNMDDYIQNFQNNHITGYDLCLLTSDDLKNELNVDKLHMRNICLRQIRIQVMEQLRLFIKYQDKSFNLQLDMDRSLTLESLIPYFKEFIQFKDNQDNCIIYNERNELLSLNCRIVELMLINPNRYRSLVVVTNTNKIQPQSLSPKASTSNMNAMSNSVNLNASFPNCFPVAGSSNGFKNVDDLNPYGKTNGSNFSKEDYLKRKPELNKYFLESPDRRSPTVSPSNRLNSPAIFDDTMRSRERDISPKYEPKYDSHTSYNPNTNLNTFSNLNTHTNHNTLQNTCPTHTGNSAKKPNIPSKNYKSSRNILDDDRDYYDPKAKTTLGSKNPSSRSIERSIDRERLNFPQKSRNLENNYDGEFSQKNNYYENSIPRGDKVNNKSTNDKTYNNKALDDNTLYEDEDTKLVGSSSYQNMNNMNLPKSKDIKYGHHRGQSENILGNDLRTPSDQIFKEMENRLGNDIEAGKANAGNIGTNGTGSTAKFASKKDFTTPSYLNKDYQYDTYKLPYAANPINKESNKHPQGSPYACKPRPETAYEKKRNHPSKFNVEYDENDNENRYDPLMYPQSRIEKENIRQGS